LFRGALGPIFSRGMDRLTKELQQAGIEADVNEFTICRWVAGRAITVYRENPAPIILIGHSMGGYCSIIFSQMLEAENIPVSLVVTIDPAHVTPEVPLNVERFINIFLSKDVLGGGDVKPQPGYHGHYASFDLSEHDEVSHITIDKMDDVHQQLIAKIVQLATTPSKGDGEPVPLRYVVPPNTAIELWDSGTAMVMRQDDTLQNIAQFFHVPLWSLTQANKRTDKARLTQGERIIIPRHLLPLTAMSASSSVRR
jgi:LysM repeat protein